MCLARADAVGAYRDLPRTSSTRRSRTDSFAKPVHSFGTDDSNPGAPWERKGARTDESVARSWSLGSGQQVPGVPELAERDASCAAQTHGAGMRRGWLAWRSHPRQHRSGVLSMSRCRSHSLAIRNAVQTIVARSAENVLLCEVLGTSSWAATLIIVFMQDKGWRQTVDRLWCWGLHSVVTDDPPHRPPAGKPRVCRGQGTFGVAPHCGGGLMATVTQGTRR